MENGFKRVDSITTTFLYKRSRVWSLEPGSEIRILAFDSGLLTPDPGLLFNCAPEDC